MRRYGKMTFVRKNWWLILLFIIAFGFLSYSSIIDMDTHKVLLNKKSKETPMEIKTAMLYVVDKSIEIDKLLKKMMSKIGADRAYVFQFHNGTRLVNGRHFYYYSNTHEVVGPGVSSEIANLQMLPISILITSWLPKLIRGKGFASDTINETHEYSKKILEDQGIISLSIVPLMDKTNTYPIGFMGVDFTKSNINPEALKILYEYTNQIRKMLWK
jgi:hypothetical protein